MTNNKTPCKFCGTICNHDDDAGNECRFCNMSSKKEMTDLVLAKMVHEAVDYDDIDDYSGRVKTIYDDAAEVIATIRAEARAEAIMEAADRAESWYRAKEYSDELSALSESRISLLRAAITQDADK